MGEGQYNGDIGHQMTFKMKVQNAVSKTLSKRVCKVTWLIRSCVVQDTRGDLSWDDITPVIKEDEEDKMADPDATWSGSVR